MLASLPFEIVEHVLSFSDSTAMSVVMCVNVELRNAVSTVLSLNQAIVHQTRQASSYHQNHHQTDILRKYGPTLLQWTKHYSPGEVKSLMLRDCHFLTDKGCKLLAARFPLLTHLDVSGCLHVSSRGIKRFARDCKNLAVFRSDTTTAHSGCGDIRTTPAYIKAVAESQKLTFLSLTLGSANKDGALAPLSLHPTLQELNLYFLGYAEVSVNIRLPSMKRLKMLRSWRNDQSWRRFLQALHNMPNLEFLQMDCCFNYRPGGWVSQQDCAFAELVNPAVLATLPQTKLSAIVVNPITAAQLLQWQALAVRNCLGQPISLSAGEKWFSERD
ncbi:hypothetical protein B484DRAFT_447786 [Ochromonadaceae sp. CCMP2298]|nr:hypothetical protein B484DRAFT_447786 [Ochromonadaceae sp. CCMP2298]|mmetsp:Transcript_33783/g.72961  ORF Transcript_33783/g.72961 Transcript_33783/m.72961 type:complete len:329 (+) Transcript_33783:91-1077(+)